MGVVWVGVGGVWVGYGWVGVWVVGSVGGCGWGMGPWVGGGICKILKYFNSFLYFKFQ